MGEMRSDCFCFFCVICFVLRFDLFAAPVVAVAVEPKHLQQVGGEVCVHMLHVFAYINSRTHAHACAVSDTVHQAPPATGGHAIAQCTAGAPPPPPSLPHPHSFLPLSLPSSFIPQLQTHPQPHTHPPLPRNRMPHPSQRTSHPSQARATPASTCAWNQRGNTSLLHVERRVVCLILEPVWRCA
jgi:hypothetical protein